MDEDIQKRWIKLPEVRIEDERILMINNKIVEIPDISSAVFLDYLLLGREAIEKQLEENQLLQKHMDISLEKRVVLVGRLALLRSANRVFTDDCMQSDKVADFDINDLNPVYGLYWKKILDVKPAKKFKPEVFNTIVMDNPQHDGVWLGLH
ncbi:MAG: hypothetical protein JWO54_988 [Candidatus Saccharibacteria bacterium]|nr:hypothetical protein [Candidatus Saccharibacteria bacterium]MDB5181225.1 hypothetical protein [Candidatus Saccharibacteria bacterium]